MPDHRAKSIIISGHAKSQLEFRGATEEEVVSAIRSAPWQQAERDRLESRMDFPFNSVWNKRHDSTKQVRPIFVNEAERIVVVTVYVYCFQEEAET